MLFDLTLTQELWDKPVLADLSNHELVRKVLNTLCEADCWFEDRPCLPDSEGNEWVELLAPRIWAAGCHQSGDIWIATATEEEHNMLVKSVNDWLPRLSD